MGAEPSARLAGSIPAGWLPLSHVEALHAVDGVELVALCDVDEALVRRRGAHYGVDGLYTDYRRLLDEVRPEIVSIATRTPSKPEIIEYACRAGVKAVYVEKPIANNLRDCSRVLAAAADAGVRIAYGVNRRYHPVYRQARDMVAAGEIGHVVEVVVEHGQSALLWAHPHSVDLILFLSGTTELSAIQAHFSADTVDFDGKLTIDSDPVVESAFFKLDGGVTAHIVRSGGLSVRVGGTAGNLTVHGDGSYIQLDRKSAAGDAYFLRHEVMHSLGKDSATVTAMTELVQAVRGDSCPSVPPAAIATSTRMLIGCAWSHLNQGKLIDAGDVPEDLTVTGRFGELYA
jgi:scyllo-inositol 2-dehydrogenase (NAD+)